MRYRTREMGVVEVQAYQTFDFTSPMLGFESFRKFAILPDPSAEPFHWLQSLEDPALAFPVVRSEELTIGYAGTEHALDAVGAASWDEVEAWVVVVIPRDGSQMRVNLRAPIATNRRCGLAGQIVVQGDYPVSYVPGTRLAAV